MNLLKRFELRAGGKEALISAGELLATESDYNILKKLNMVMIKDDYIIWIDPTYPNYDAVYSDIKRKAGESKLILSDNNEIYEVYCLYNTDWSIEDEIMYQGYQQKGIKDIDGLEEYLYNKYWDEVQ